MSIMPWGKAEKLVAVFESSPSSCDVSSVRDAIEDLKRLESIPGVKSRRADLEKRFLASRARLFDSLFDQESFEPAWELVKDIPLASRGDEELIKVAHLGLRKGRNGPSLASIAPSAVKWELRSAFYETVLHEVMSRGDEGRAEEILALWLQHDPLALVPNLAMIRRYLLSGHYDHAVAQYHGLPENVRTNIAGKIKRDTETADHAKAHFLIQTGWSDLAKDVLDTILTEQPDDEWALTQRAYLADQESDGSSARHYYARLLARDPSQSGVARRLAELAQSESDDENARENYKAAWQAGDFSSGFSYLGYFLRDDRESAKSIAAELAAGLNDGEGLLAIADIFLELGMVDEASSSFQRAVDIDKRVTDTAIGKAHAYVEKKSSGRLSLLRFLAVVAPIRGYPADIYLLMEVDEHLESGEKSKAVDCLERLMRTELRWKALARLADLTLGENAPAQLRTAERIAAVLPQAETAGRSVWAELAYYSARLLEAAGRNDEARRRYQEVIGREFHYRDIEERLAGLDTGRVAPSTDSAAVAADRTVMIKRPVEPQSRYELMECLGEGGMGSVHKARDRKLDRIVALKLLNISGDPKAEDMLVREARTTAKLNHPNIVAVYDVEREGGRWAIAMEYVDGVTLKAMIAKGPFEREAALTTIAAVLSALVPAHEHGVIHRDIKPANVMVRGGEVSFETVKLCDFGLARVSTDASIVLPGTVAGTAAYMSPEQIRGDKVGPQTDIYACGCVLYEMISGQPLFKSESATTTMFMHLNEEPGRLMANEVLSDEHLAELLLGFLARDPALRYTTAAEALRAVMPDKLR